jgi:hypothetical protein
MLNISRYFLSDGLCRAAGMSAGLLIRDSRDLNGFPSVFSRESPADGLFLRPKFSAEIARGASVQASRRPAAGRQDQRSDRDRRTPNDYCDSAARAILKLRWERRRSALRGQEIARIGIETGAPAGHDEEDIGASTPSIRRADFCRRSYRHSSRP